MAERQRQTVESAYAEPWKPEKEGDVIEGTYLGYTMVPSPRKGQGKFKSYNLKTDNGKYIGVSGAVVGGMLSRVPVGSYVWITFMGFIETNQGEAKNFKVETEKGIKLLDPVTKSRADEDGATGEDDIPF